MSEDGPVERPRRPEVPRPLLEEFFGRLGLVMDRCAADADGVVILCHWAEEITPVAAPAEGPPHNEVVLERNLSIDLTDPRQLAALEAGVAPFHVRSLASG